MRNYNALLAAFAAVFLVLATPAFATSEKSTEFALEAKESLDAHFGRQVQLVRAASLLTRALEEDQTNAIVFVQAARLTIKGGYVVRTQFRPGTVDAYGELLDRALKLDPKNTKAHILKAEYFHFKGDYSAERSELDKAQEVKSSDPWLLVGYGRHYEAVDDSDRALSYYVKVMNRGPGTSVEDRNAYIQSLTRIGAFAASMGDLGSLMEMVRLVRKERDPRDAWCLGNLAARLVHVGMFEEAISLSREALKTMNYGAGRLTLTAALYGKAAELTAAGKSMEAAPILREARANGYSRSSVLGQFLPGYRKVTELRPTLEALIN